MIRNARRKNLGFVFQTPESPGVDHAIAVALKRIAIRMRQFRIPSTARAFERKPQMSQRAGQVHLVPVITSLRPAARLADSPAEDSPNP